LILKENDEFLINQIRMKWMDYINKQIKDIDFSYESSKEASDINNYLEEIKIYINEILSSTSNETLINSGNLDDDFDYYDNHYSRNYNSRQLKYSSKRNLAKNSIDITKAKLRVKEHDNVRVNNFQQENLYLCSNTQKNENFNNFHNYHMKQQITKSDEINHLLYKNSFETNFNDFNVNKNKEEKNSYFINSNINNKIKIDTNDNLTKMCKISKIINENIDINNNQGDFKNTINSVSSSFGNLKIIGNEKLTPLKKISKLRDSCIILIF